MAGGQAVQLLLQADLQMLRLGSWNGSKLQVSGNLSPLLSVGCPMVAGSALAARGRDPAAPKVANMDRLLTAAGSEIHYVRGSLQAGLSRLHESSHGVLKAAMTAGEAPRAAKKMEWEKRAEALSQQSAALAAAAKPRNTALLWRVDLDFHPEPHSPPKWR